MAIVVDGSEIELREDSTSPSISIQGGERVITRKLFMDDDGIDFTKIDQLIADMFPLFDMPGAYPAPNGSSLFFIVSANIQPHGGSPDHYGDVNTYRSWMITATYKASKFKPGNKKSLIDDPLVLLQKEESGAPQFVSIPGASLYFENQKYTNGDESIPVTKRALVVTYTMTRHYYKMNPAMRNLLRLAAGKINRSDFPANHLVFPGVRAGTLLFEGFTVSSALSSDGSVASNLVMTFNERQETQLRPIADATFDPENPADNNPITGYANTREPVTWNHFWDQGTRRYRLVYTREQDLDADPQSIQTEADFVYQKIDNSLFDRLFTV